MTQVYQNHSYDSQNAFLSVVDIPDTRTRHRHLNALCNQNNWGEKSAYRGLDPNLIYVGGRGSDHGKGATVLYVMREPPAPLDLSSIFADMERLPLAGDIPARAIDFSVWECAWGQGDTLYVIMASGVSKPGYAVLTSAQLEDALKAGDPDAGKGDHEAYQKFLVMLNEELNKDKDTTSAEDN